MKAVFNSIVLSLFLLGVNTSVYACELEKEIVSLSGPITMLIEEFGLMNDPKLKAVSKFHPLKNSKKFKGEVLAGGMFLSPRTIKKYNDSVIFFDKSREMKRSLKKSGHPNSIEVDTRDQDPFEAFYTSLIKLGNYLHKCEANIVKLEEKIRGIKKDLEKGTPHKKMIFFLGEIMINGRLPELVIANDGPVLFLKKDKSFKSYNSELAYVNWSKKEMNNLKDEFILVGLLEGKKEKVEVKKMAPKLFNLKFRGLLVPGIRQIYFLKEFQSLSFLH